MECQIKIKQGMLQGKEAYTYNGTKYYSFEGIPYAKPPVGELRFKNPVPIDNWLGIKDATKPGNKCSQINVYGLPNIQGSEDCLYLNIYTPKLNGTYPVIFFVHGGRLFSGYGDYYKPDFFIEKNIVLVTVNYRLNILGFLCLHTREAPGNVGLKDTVLALKFVNENISFFGGNSQNVTVFGESAGSAIVNTYLVSDSTEGLFHKMILESGTAISDLFLRDKTVEKAGWVCEKMGFKAGNVDEMYEFLMKAPIEELLKAVRLVELEKKNIDSVFLTVVEKKYDGLVPHMTEDPKVLFKQNRQRKVPILFGLMSQEGAYFLQRNKKGDILYNDNLEYFLPDFFNLKPGSKESKNIALKLRNYYFGAKKIDDSTKDSYLALASDAFFNRDLTLVVDLMSKNYDHVYFYRFSYAGNLNTRIMKHLGMPGATHGDILAYQFYREKKMSACTKKDAEVIEFLTGAIRNFVLYGKPTSNDSTIVWPHYESKRRYCLDVGEDIKHIPYPYNDRVEFWFDLMKSKCKL